MRGDNWSNLAAGYPDEDPGPDDHGYVAGARQLCAGSNREVEGPVGSTTSCPVCQRAVVYRPLARIVRAGKEVERHIVEPHQNIGPPEREGRKPRIRTAVEE